MNQYVSVIIPTYHDWDRLKLCLDALEQQTYAKDKFEVIVVNNDPSDLPPNLNLPNNFQVISEGKPGSYAARNAALAIAKGEIFAFTDSDCIPNNDWIENAVSVLNAGSERVAGHIELFYKNKNLTLAEIYEKAFAFNQKAQSMHGNAATANLITFKWVFEKVGGFNPNLLSGGDMEWGLKAKEAGVNIVYASNVIIKHPARSNLSELINKKKRVAGGVANSKKLQQRFYLIKGFIPPLKACYELKFKDEMSLKEKFVACLISYYLKLIGTFEVIKIRMNLTKEKRS